MSFPLILPTNPLHLNPQNRFLFPNSSPNFAISSPPPIKLSRKRSLNLSIRFSSDSTAIIEDSSAASSSNGSVIDYSDEENEAISKVGARVRVKGPLKVYHIPRIPEFDLNGLEGELKQFVGIWKGKRISANFPFKIQFVENIEGRDGAVKFFAHLKEDEFEYLD